MLQLNKPNILVIDIEWKPAKAFVWRMWDENITPAQLIDEGGLLCFCWHWLGKKEFEFASEWENGRDGMAIILQDILGKADAVVTYNGDKYDLRKITGEILLAGLLPPPPPTSIDLLKVVKRFGFVMNRLAYIGPLLKVGAKVKNEGFDLWKSVMNGDAKAQARMKKYCIQDVRMTKNLYERIKPFIPNHPNLGHGQCGACGSNSMNKRGYRYSRFFKTQRLQCNKCGSWTLGSRSKVC